MYLGSTHFRKNMDRKFRIPRSIAVAMSIGFLIMVGVFVFILFFQQIAAFSHDWGTMKSKLPEASVELKRMASKPETIIFPLLMAYN